MKTEKQIKDIIEQEVRIYILRLAEEIKNQSNYVRDNDRDESEDYYE